MGKQEDYETENKRARVERKRDGRPRGRDDHSTKQGADHAGALSRQAPKRVAGDEDVFWNELGHDGGHRRRVEGKRDTEER